MISRLLTAALLVSFAGSAHAQIDTAWIRSQGGTDSGSFIGHAMCLGVDGRIAVVGEAPGATNGQNMTTLLYLPDGTLYWQRSFDGPQSGNDVATGVQFAPDGSVVVTGQMRSPQSETSGGALKYDSDGNLEWAVTIGNIDDAYVDNSAPDVVVDQEGNVIVTATTASFLNAVDGIITVKYSSAGTYLWGRTYEGDAGYWYPDAFGDLAVDSDGNIYVTGTTSTGSGKEVATIKYSPSGVRLWLRLYDPGWHGDDRAESIAEGADGFIYVTATSFGTTGNDDILTMKYDTAGTLLWSRRFNGIPDKDEVGVAAIADAQGHVWVTGMSVGFFTLADIVLVRYDINGIPSWARRYSGPGLSVDFPRALAIDPAGNCYISGFSGPSPPTYEYTTLNYDSNGTQQWERRFGTGDGLPDSASAMVVDINGNVYVTGRSNRDSPSEAITTLKYSPCGVATPVGTAAISHTTPCNGEPYVVSWNSSPDAETYELHENGSSVYFGPDTQMVLTRDAGDLYYTVRASDPVCGKSGFTAPSEHVIVTPCGCHGDIQCDGLFDIVDVTRIINEAFRGAAADIDAGCPHVSRSDVDCNCHVSITDVVRVIDVAFRGGDEGQFCSPCVSPCL